MTGKPHFGLRRLAPELARAEKPTVLNKSDAPSSQLRPRYAFQSGAAVLHFGKSALKFAHECLPVCPVHRWPDIDATKVIGEVGQLNPRFRLFLIRHRFQQRRPFLPRRTDLRSIAPTYSAQGLRTWMKRRPRWSLLVSRTVY